MSNKRNLAEWDAEIEADFQRVVAATKAAGRRKHGRRYVGFPLAFFIDVWRQTEGRIALGLAICIYRRTHVCHSLTVTLPPEELKELGVSRRRKNEALAKLQAAGLIRIESAGAGQSAEVTLLWR